MSKQIVRKKLKPQGKSEISHLISELLPMRLIPNPVSHSSYIQVLSPYSTEKRVCVGCPTQMKLT